MNKLEQEQMRTELRDCINNGRKFHMRCDKDYLPDKENLNKEGVWIEIIPFLLSQDLKQSSVTFCVNAPGYKSEYKAGTLEDACLVAMEIREALLNE